MSVKNAMDQNVSQELNQPNVLLVKGKDMLILGKDQCKFKWHVKVVLVKVLLILHHVSLVKDKEWLIKL